MENENNPFERLGVMLFPEQEKAIGAILTGLYEMAPAKFVLLTDTNGRVVSTRGDQTVTDPVALGALVAGDLAASQEIARLSGDYQENQMIMREGSRVNTLIFEAGAALVLLLQISREVPMGWARMLLRKAVQQIAVIFLSPPSEDEKHSADLGKEDLSGLVEGAIDDIWGN